MRTLPGNPHAHDVAMHQARGNNLTPSVQATLAVAYELRTATLVQALLHDSLVGDAYYDEMVADARASLGLGGEGQ